MLIDRDALECIEDTLREAMLGGETDPAVLAKMIAGALMTGGQTRAHGHDRADGDLAKAAERTGVQIPKMR
jgi:hypothetical protein